MRTREKSPARLKNARHSFRRLLETIGPYLPESEIPDGETPTDWQAYGTIRANPHAKTRLGPSRGDIP